VVKLLLRTAEVDLKDNYDRTLLWCVVNRGYKTVVKLLLRTSEVDVDSNANSG
jgi:hypothetical protein